MTGPSSFPSPFLSCREASRLITAELDRELGPFEKIALGLHLRACDGCPTVVRQMALIHDAVHGWRDTAEG